MLLVAWTGTASMFCSRDYVAGILVKGMALPLADLILLAYNMGVLA